MNIGPEHELEPAPKVGGMKMVVIVVAPAIAGCVFLAAVITRGVNWLLRMR